MCKVPRARRVRPDLSAHKEKLVPPVLKEPRVIPGLQVRRATQALLEHRDNPVPLVRKGPQASLVLPGRKAKLAPQAPRVKPERLAPQLYWLSVDCTTMPLRTLRSLRALQRVLS